MKIKKDAFIESLASVECAKTVDAGLTRVALTSKASKVGPSRASLSEQK